jgi:hypothetical protein
MAIGPHPLVVALAKALRPPDSTSSTTQQTEGATEEELMRAAALATEEFARAADLPQLVAFAGFLGGTVPQPGMATDWRLLYLDWRLLNWLLVKDDDVLHVERVKDPTAPSGERDVIWVNADAPVRGGSGAESVEARFLTGDFTRAGDFDAAPSGGTGSAATGIFCEARTPFCCYGRSRR